MNKILFALIEIAESQKLILYNHQQNLTCISYLAYAQKDKDFCQYNRIGSIYFNRFLALENVCLPTPVMCLIIKPSKRTDEYDDLITIIQPEIITDTNNSKLIFKISL